MARNWLCSLPLLSSSHHHNLCRKYIVFTCLFGRNITKAMSTLLILLFSKMAWIASDVIHSITVHAPSNKTHFHVLFIDGNVEFLSKQHIPLMVVSTIITASLLLITFYLLFNQILIRISSIRCFKWVARLAALLWNHHRTLQQELHLLAWLPFPC